jgi:hypothetical protein
MEISAWFLAIFVLIWIAGPLTQVLFLAAPKLHHRLGMTEDEALKPEFRWFLLDEKAIAIADLTYFISGGAFIWLALLGNQAALIFGLYSCACYVYIAPLAISRWHLLGKNHLSPMSRAQAPIYMAYMAVYFCFGLYGLFYLWGHARV